MFKCPSIYSSIHPSIHPSIHLFIHPSIYSSTYPSTHPPIYLFIPIPLYYRYDNYETCYNGIKSLLQNWDREKGLVRLKKPLQPVPEPEKVLAAPKKAKSRKVNQSVYLL